MARKSRKGKRRSKKSRSSRKRIIKIGGSALFEVPRDIEKAFIEEWGYIMREQLDIKPGVLDINDKDFWEAFGEWFPRFISRYKVSKEIENNLQTFTLTKTVEKVLGRSTSLRSEVEFAN